MPRRPNLPPVAESRQRAIENSHLCSSAPLRVTNKRIELIGRNRRAD